MDSPDRPVFRQTMFYDAFIMAGRPPLYEAPPFGQRLAVLRKAHGYSQEHFGALVGKSRRAIDYYERRSKNPTTDFIEAAAKVFNVTMAELMGEESPGQFKQKPGPRSALEAQFERVKQLPKSQQQKIMEVVEALLAQNQAT
jgi:transcriptional regulator with XRE-family HTH domain